MKIDIIALRAKPAPAQSLAFRWLAAFSPYVLILIACLPSLLVRLDSYPPPWFDEGYKLNAAYTLANEGQYATYTVNGYIPFDPGISSGPADVIPVALNFQWFGVSVNAARAVSVMFTMIAIMSLHSVAGYLYGQPAALFMVLAMIAFPTVSDTGLLLIGRQILGEPAALALVALGLWLWFSSWEHNSIMLSILAGVAIGLGLLSKTQIAIALVPALMIIAAARWWRNRFSPVILFTPIVLIVAIFAGWMLIGSMATSPDIRQMNSALLMDAIRSNLLTGLFGRTLTLPALLIIVVMGSAAAGALGRWWRIPASKRLSHNQQWAEATLTVFVILSAGWFTLFSVGWPRYAYAGLVIALLLAGKLAWDVLKKWTQIETNNWIYASSIAGLVVLALFNNLYPAFQQPTMKPVKQMAGYIAQAVPANAVIETWEWELDALSGHRAYHHPDQAYLFLAIRQFSHDRRTFDLQYDGLQADPDYLVAGKMSDWTGIYPADMLEADFRLVTTFGSYRLYERSRS